MKSRALWGELPPELQLEIASYLDPVSQSAMVRTSHQFYGLFQKTRLTHKFLLHIARGEEDKAQHILALNPDLLFAYGNVTDYSGRHFIRITGFQYALWALDFYMWKMILMSLPPNEKGDLLKRELLRQYDELEEKGVSYKLNGNRYHEKHYDFSSILRPMQAYFEDTKECCINNVGVAQRLVPAHIAQHYCNYDIHFKHLLPLKNDTFIRQLTFCNIGKSGFNHEDAWFPLSASDGSILGVNVVISRDSEGLIAGNGKILAFCTTGSYCTELDFKYLTELCAKSHLALLDLRQVLQTDHNSCDSHMNSKPNNAV